MGIDLAMFVENSKHKKNTTEDIYLRKLLMVCILLVSESKLKVSPLPACAILQIYFIEMSTSFWHQKVVVLSLHHFYVLCHHSFCGAPEADTFYAAAKIVII